MTTPRALALASCTTLALSLALALTGCAGGAPAGGATDAATSAPSATGTQAAVTLPADFPSDAVPVIDATLVKAGLAGGIYTAVFTSDNLTASLADATAKLVAAGFAQTTTDPLYGDFATADYKVRVFIVEADKSITYLVTSLKAPSAAPTPEPTATH